MSNDDGPGGVVDPTTLELDELRSLRTEMQQRDDVVSYARRVAQTRLDLVRAEMSRRGSNGDAGAGDGSAGLGAGGEAPRVPARQLDGVPARPPRSAEDLSDDALSVELDAICAEHHYGGADELDLAELSALADAISEFEQRVSQDRLGRFGRLDALSAELVRRYRDGEASVDSLLDD